MTEKLSKFLADLEKKDFLRVIKTVAKFPKVEELICELKNHGLTVSKDVAEELCTQFQFPIEEKDIATVFGGFYDDMDELDWEYFSKHPEYGVIRR